MLRIKSMFNNEPWNLEYDGSVQYDGHEFEYELYSHVDKNNAASHVISTASAEEFGGDEFIYYIIHKGGYDRKNCDESVCNLLSRKKLKNPIPHGEVGDFYDCKHCGEGVAVFKNAIYFPCRCSLMNEEEKKQDINRNSEFGKFLKGRSGQMVNGRLCLN